MPTFSRNVYQDEEYQKEHEFQVIGLIPDTENTITFYITNEDGSTDTKEIVYEMGSLYGEEAVQLDTDVKQSADKLEDGCMWYLEMTVLLWILCIIMTITES